MAQRPCDAVSPQSLEDSLRSCTREYTSFSDTPRQVPRHAFEESAHSNIWRPQTIIGHQTNDRTQCTYDAVTPRSLESGFHTYTREAAIHPNTNLNPYSSGDPNHNSSSNTNANHSPNSGKTKFGLSPATRKKIGRYYIWFIVFLLVSCGIAAVVLYVKYNHMPSSEPSSQYEMVDGFPPERPTKDEKGWHIPGLEPLESRQLVVPVVQDIPVDDNGMPTGPIPLSVGGVGQSGEEATEQIVVPVQNEFWRLLSDHGEARSTVRDVSLLKRVEPRQPVARNVQDTADDNGKPAKPVPWTVKNFVNVGKKAAHQFLMHFQNGFLSLLGGHGWRAGEKGKGA